MPPTSAASASPAGPSLEAKIRKLEQQLSTVTAERNDLAADVEALCMQSSGDIFSASSVLGDRICNIQKEANKLQTQVCAHDPMWWPALASADAGLTPPAITLVTVT